MITEAITHATTIAVVTYINGVRIFILAVEKFAATFVGGDELLFLEPLFLVAPQNRMLRFMNRVNDACFPVVSWWKTLKINDSVHSIAK